MCIIFLQVGYCQGTAFIVGLLLMQMPEEDAFAVLVRIMQNYRMREMFKPSMAELGLCMYQLDVLVQEHIPDLSAHFQVLGQDLFLCALFLSKMENGHLFSSSLPLLDKCHKTSRTFPKTEQTFASARSFGVIS